MFNDPVAQWLQSQSCVEEHGLLRTHWAPVIELYFQPEGSGWAAFVGCADVPNRMRIGTCANLEQVQALFAVIRQMNAQSLAA